MSNYEMKILSNEKALKPVKYKLPEGGNTYLNCYKKKVVKKSNGEIIGSLVKKKETEDYLLIKLEETEHLLPIDADKKSARRYVYVGDNKFIGVPGGFGFLIPIFIIVAVACIGLFLFLNYNPQEKNPLDVSDGIDTDSISDTTVDEEEAMTIYDGYSAVTVNENDPYVNLSNNEKNTVYFKYSVYTEDNDTLIYETNLIEPGKTVQWNAYEDVDISAGDNKVYFVIDTYDLDKSTQLSSVPNTNITITKQ